MARRQAAATPRPVDVRRGEPRAIAGTGRSRRPATCRWTSRSGWTFAVCTPIAWAEPGRPWPARGWAPLLVFDQHNIRYLSGTVIGEWARDKLTRWSSAHRQRRALGVGLRLRRAPPPPLRAVDSRAAVAGRHGRHARRRLAEGRPLQEGGPGDPRHPARRGRGGHAPRHRPGGAAVPLRPAGGRASRSATASRSCSRRG